MEKVLIIDDDPGILEATKYALEFAGFAVQTASDSKKAISTAKKYKPDIVLLDLLLSGENSKKIIHGFRNNSELKKIPIIILSAHPLAETSAKEAGADDFLPKPFNIDELVDKIEKTIKRGEVSHE